jgi:hypothetical protein
MRKNTSRTSKISYIWNPVNAIIFIVISLLREDPLSTGILDMFFSKISDHSSLCKTEVIYLKFHQIFNSFNSNELN